VKLKINFLDIIHRFSVIKTRRFGDWSLSPSSGKTYSVGSNVEEVCYFNNTPSSKPSDSSET
jgi:hypothetical protein